MTPKEASNMENKKVSNTENQSVVVALCSRLDYGGEGYRSGLLEAGFKIFSEQDSKFVIIAGGLVAGRALEEQCKKFIRENLAERQLPRRFPPLK